jgi:hypothetical protein
LRAFLLHATMSLFPLACGFFFFSLLLLDLAWFRVRVGGT